jgi:uncharacterized protein (TIGR03435 family)
VSSARYDFQAKSDAAVNHELRLLSPHQASLMKERMLQSLLEDRFKLTLRRETKIVPVYALVIGKHGSKLHEAKDTGGPASARHGWTDNQWRNGEVTETFHDYTVRSLAVFVSSYAGRRVLDGTGLGGRYNFTLRWAHGTRPAPGPSIFTAIKEQLGLRLKPEKGPVDFYVIEHIERPTPN